MNIKNVFKKTFFINDSYSRQKIMESLTTSPRYIKEIRKYSLGITPKKNSNNNPYLITDFKLNQNELNLISSSKRSHNKDLLKNMYFNEDNSVILNSHLINKKNKKSAIAILSKKNKFNKINLNEVCESNIDKINFKGKNQKIEMRTITSFHISNDSQINFKKNNTNYSSNATQSYNSCNSNMQRNRNLYLRSEDNINRKENIKKFELNLKDYKSDNFNGLNKITFIEQHINKLLSKENNPNDKLKLLLNKTQEKNKDKDKDILAYNHKTFNNFYDRFNTIEVIKEQSNKKVRNNSLLEKEKEKEKNKEKINLHFHHVNYIDFKSQLDDLVHKIKFIDNYKEFENFVKTLTNEELYYILSNKDKNILPMFMKNKKKLNLKLDFKQSFSFKEKTKNLVSIEQKKGELNQVNHKNNIPKRSIINYIAEKKNNYKKKLFPKLMYSNKNIFNTPKINKIDNKNIILPNNKFKDKDKEKISEIKNETSLKEDLSFLGNSNKLNWNLISDEDKERGIIFWRKFLRYVMYNKIDEDTDNSIKNRNKKKANFTSTDTDFNNQLKNKDKDKAHRYMSAILKSYQFLKEHNRRKKLYSLDFYNSFNTNSQTNIRKKNINSEMKKSFKQNINDEFKDKFSLYDNKIEKKNYFNQKNNKTFKYKFNIKNSFIKNNSNKNKNSKNKIKSSIFKTPNNKFSKNNYTINQNFSDKKFKKSNLRMHNLQDNSSEDKKQVNFIVEETPSKKMQVDSSIVPTKKSLNKEYKKFLRKSSKKLKRINLLEIESLEEVRQYLMNYYKISEDVYSSIDLNNNKAVPTSEESKNEKEVTQKKVKEPTKIIDLFGVNVIVKNSNKVLEEYLLKRHLDQIDLMRQIQFKNKLLILIKNLEEEKKERMKRREEIRNRYKMATEENNLEINEEFLNDRRWNKKRKKKDKTNDSDSDEGGFDLFKRKKYFVNRKFKSRKDVEMRKLELLYSIKNDLNYKIMKGYINISDYDIYDKLKERLARLINIYSMQDYIDRIEECFSEFQEEMILVEQRRRNEQRINAFVKDLNHQIDVKSIEKNIQEKKLCNVINYDTVNHINILNNI